MAFPKKVRNILLQVPVIFVVLWLIVTIIVAKVGRESIVTSNDYHPEAEVRKEYIENFEPKIKKSVAVKELQDARFKSPPKEPESAEPAPAEPI